MASEEAAAFDFSLPVEEKAFVSKPDFLGERLIWYTSPNKFGWLDTFQGFVSDLKGLIKFTYIEMARKDFRDFVRHLKSDKRLTVVEIDPSEAKWLIERGAKDTPEMPADFKRWRKILSEPRELATPRDLAASISSEITEESREEAKENLHLMLNDEEFATWIIEFDRAMEYAQRVLETSSSTVVVNEQIRKDRINNLLISIVKEYFSDRMCAVYKHRLQEIAKIQKILGKQDSAQNIWILSEHFAGAENIERNPFAYGIMERSVALIMEELKKRQETALIKTPSQKDLKAPDRNAPPGLIK